MSAVWILSALCLLLTVWITCLLLQKRKQERAIRMLINYLTKVQDIASLPDMKTMAEGQLGILESEIYKVVSLLKEEYASEHRQKRYMTDMMSDISHQMKTPLTAVSLMSELLMAPDVSEEKRLEYASRIENQVDKMTWLIRNLLTLSQLEAGVLEMKCESVLLSTIMDSIAESLGVMADVSNVRLDIRIPEGLSVWADPHWFQEALSNIVKNAVEHTGSGGYVRILAQQNNLSTTIRIEDNGEGIDPSDLPHIFERFYKTGRNTSSVGIGLAMARQIIRNLNGAIEAASHPGQGTVFTITLYI